MTRDCCNLLLSSLYNLKDSFADVCTQKGKGPNGCSVLFVAC